MKKQIIISFIASALLLSGCAEDTSSAGASLPETGTPTSAVTEVPQTSAAPETTALPAEPELSEPFKAELVSCENYELTYEYEGRTYTLPLTGSARSSTIPRLIGNRFGFRIKAVLRTQETPDGTEVAVCGDFEDVKVIDSFSLAKKESMFDNTFKQENLNTLIHRHGSIYELGNRFGVTYEIDLNDVSNDLKDDFGEFCTDISVMGYKLGDAGLLIEHIYKVTEMTKNEAKGREPYGNLRFLRFLGTVKKLDGERAEVLLTDGITTLDVPYCLTDGEVKEGAEAAVVCKAEADLYGSGETFTDDYAVFYTSPRKYLPEDDRDPSHYAYFKQSDRAPTTYVKADTQPAVP